ncbi:hypothetical protein CsatB_009969 [Cannabis sativa]|nr:norbelladine synthase [Cannabis sativa]
MVSGQLSHEMEIKAPASQVWEFYGTIRQLNLIAKQLPNVFEKIDILEGDGGVGTIVHLIFVPGVTRFKSYKEKLTKVDDENRVKEAEVIEGGYLDFGFTLYRVRFEIIDKDQASSIVKSTIEYEVKDESADNVSLVSLDALKAIAFIAQNELTKTNA